MEPDELRESERLLSMDYQASDLPKLPHGEDLQTEDPAEAEHWVSVYMKLVEFTRSALEWAAERREDRRPGPAKNQSSDRRVILQAMVHELHLRYWTDRLTRLRSSGAEGDQAS